MLLSEAQCSSKLASERALRAAFMDAMAVTGRFKKPHLFITKTTDPNWPEIQRELIGDEKAVDRHIPHCFSSQSTLRFRQIWSPGSSGSRRSRCWRRYSRMESLVRVQPVSGRSSIRSGDDPTVFDLDRPALSKAVCGWSFSYKFHNLPN
jgi:helitron helicase-like protein